MRRRLLVVDDNAAYRRLVRLALRDDPAYEVVAEAGEAAEAVAAATEQPPDVALVDVLLPAGDGFRLPARLREAAPGCVVVFTSAHPEGDLDAMRAFGGIGFLPKSVTPKELGRELDALLAVLDQVQDVVHEASTHLPPSRESPRAARRFVQGILPGWGCADVLDSVTLLVSELVGNAVMHARSEIEVSVRLGTDRLRVDVIDRSTAVPRRRSAGSEDQTGRGSDLVEVLATAWGVSGRPDGKSVWFEIALPAGMVA